MKKGIAIQTILLLLVGILVVGVLVYFVYSYTAGSTALSTTGCKSELTSICTVCSIRGWSGGLGTDYMNIVNTCNDLTEFDSFPEDPRCDTAAFKDACSFIGAG